MTENDGDQREVARQMSGDGLTQATERKVVRTCECGQSFKTVPDGPERCPWCKVVIDGGDDGPE